MNRQLQYRSKLFVHGSEPDTYGPAFATCADSIVLNNEDHVDDDMKDQSRRWIVDYLDTLERSGRVMQVRVNEFASPFFKDDLEAFVHPMVDVINLTKVDAPETVIETDSRLTELEARRGLEKPIGLLLTIESPAGLRRVAELACCCKRVVGLQIGYGDLLRPLGIDFQGPGADVVRLMVRMAAAEAGISAFDGAFLGDVADAAGYEHDARRGVSFGFTGKSCNTSEQVDIANRVFTR